ncbi:ATP-binding cassette domain-containing protein [Streptomyces sp. 351MFTsu5.1]|uniref:ATP-binding cassette domain-containing protein n=1 Tax=Streptomyces sp. 351MFTsu5.1 TaxID=1172180 RepID=UPI00037D8C17|nr:ABC transporter ATP-binding protein [Streptomyces sp. 351MFTsu5.1]
MTTARGAAVSDGVPARGLRYLRARWRVVVRLGGWSVLETAQTFLTGYAPARALDEGFLAGRPGVGLGWLAVAGLGVLVGAFGTVRVYAAVAALVEPLRDALVRRVVARGVREADPGALSGLTQQVEIARDTFAGLVMVSRSFVFTAVGAVVGLASLDPLLLLVVGPPLAAGLGLFAATLRPLARRQEEFLVADEALADGLGRVCPGLRDITASGAEERVAEHTGRLVEAEQRAAYSLAHWSVLRVASLTLGGQLPIVLLLVCTPWLLSRGVSTGALVGALAYVTQSLLPALHNLVHGLGTSGSRLVVVLRRLIREPTLEDEPGPVPLADADEPNPHPEHVSPRPARKAAERNPPHIDDSAPRQNTHADDTNPHPEPASSARSRRAADSTSHPVSPVDPPRADTEGGVSGPGVGIRPGRWAGGPGRRPDPATRTADRGSGAVRVTAATARASAAPPSSAGTPALELTSLSFAYGPTATRVVDGLDLTLAPGAHLAVVGPSGIGKSTLTALVAGLLRPTGGRIRLLGHPVPSPGAAARRVLIPQEAYVHTGTLAENLAHLREGPVPEPELRAAAEAVGLAPLMEALGGPGASVDPAALSAGERQLVALVRAYLSPAPLVLLDEATCHLDPGTEERAERAFAERPGTTLVVVAHRISSARRAGHVLLMDGPRTAYGTHDELVRESPAYRELVGGRPAVPPSEPALPLRDPDRVDAVAGPGLAGDGGHVVAHGPVGQVQASRDLRDGGPLGREG